MSKPFAVVSDRHFHAFSAFAEVTPEGINSRLAIQLAEMRRVAEKLREMGGRLIVDCGDTFHVRGSVAPTVLNPVADLHKKLVEEGFEIVSLAGNHDLESKHSARISNAVTALEAVGVRVMHEPWVEEGWGDGGFAFIPWMPDLKELWIQIRRVAENLKDGPLTLFLHAPLNGVIPGIPDHGLDPADLGALGFKRVFCGHYHDHKRHAGEVYSVGALTHQTWSDVGTKAGFLIVEDDCVHRFDSHAPRFIDLNASAIDPEELPLMVDGHYVRAKIESSDPKEIDTLRAALIDYGAKGVVINSVRASAVTARTGSVAAGASLEASVVDFVRGKKFDNEPAVLAECNDILATVRAA